MRPEVFVSFDYDNDRHYKYLLEAWHAHPQFDFVFADATPNEIDSSNVARVKAALTSKINQASHTLVIVGRYANAIHRHSLLIGYKNWINFEIHQSKLARNRIVAVKIDRNYESPTELLFCGATWAMSFNEASIIRALGEVNRHFDEQRR